MNKILVEVSVGELLDKISILEIKQEKIKNPESLKFIKDEYNILKAELDKNVKNDEKLKDNKDLDKILDGIEIVKNDLGQIDNSEIELLKKYSESTNAIGSSEEVFI